MALFDEKAPGKFYDAWESAPEEERQRVIRERLDDYVHFARGSSSYYRDRLAAYDARATHPLVGVPVLGSSELRELVPPRSQAIVAEAREGYTVFQSGGTTGAPKSTLFSHGELEQLNLPNARGFYACGLTSQDRVGDLFASGSLYMTFVHINRMLQQYGCINFPFANHTAPEFMHMVIRVFGINCLTGVSSILLDALRAMEKLGLEKLHIEKILFGGEHLYEADRRELLHRVGASVIKAPGYGTVDTWYLGYQCLDSPSGVFHAHDDQSYLEIVDEETGRHCDPPEVGMLYATAMPRRVMPVVRYRVGDRARWLPERCVCGRTTPLFQLLGRGDDVLRIAYDSIDYQAIQDVALTVPGLLGSIQMQKDREAGRDRLTIRVETDLPREGIALARLALERELLARRPTLARLVAEGSIWPVVVECFAPGGLPRNARTGKLVRVIDAELR